MSAAAWEAVPLGEAAACASCLAAFLPLGARRDTNAAETRRHPPERRR